MSEHQNYRQASFRADQRKAILLSSLGDAKARLAPARLMADAKDKVIGAVTAIPNIGVEKARQRPLAVGSAVGAFLIYLFRRPLGTFFNRQYVRLKHIYSENDDA
ncbi:hypothetical protein WG907_15460 [Sphingobium sp. AN558]|uniref:hypothetical protein n=1 Tax=Sphingobium sp. AN558 TaxID=3133442 RepID=UPI0030C08610